MENGVARHNKVVMTGCSSCWNGLGTFENYLAAGRQRRDRRMLIPVKIIFARKSDTIFYSLSNLRGWKHSLMAILKGRRPCRAGGSARAAVRVE
eukprot:312339-Pleurochrysis_carterae.AAC.1